MRHEIEVATSKERLQYIHVYTVIILLRNNNIQQTITINHHEDSLANLSIDVNCVIWIWGRSPCILVTEQTIYQILFGKCKNTFQGSEVPKKQGLLFVTDPNLFTTHSLFMFVPTSTVAQQGKFLAAFNLGNCSSQLKVLKDENGLCWLAEVCLAQHLRSQRRAIRLYVSMIQDVSLWIIVQSGNVKAGCRKRWW